jgi:hypothetical protein
MAFDQTTRNRLNRFVADARKLLANEFTRQLQAIYGMNPVTGDVADIKTLMGLTPSQQESAQLLRDTFEHYLANGVLENSKGKEKERRLAALDRIVREQAFTVLNRIAALRMSEARGFLIESVASGYESKGFQLFHRLAGTSLGETGDAYRHYLFSIFDEFSVDLSILFDRFSAQGRLFPSTPVLIKLLEIVNDEEVTSLWAEDETIGWIYQFWNGRDEIDKMRSSSRAPRNSREMAVRNQFFTPRYIVEFLTDNTLGRLWYEMTQGNTKLVDICEYLVRRPNEIFLNEGDFIPKQDETEDYSQEELLQKTVYIVHRLLKDPRDIKMLDPACGSMHFGLYCFDLFEHIYEESWNIELSSGSSVFIREDGKQALTETYHDKADFLKHVPCLIIENNIHGVDIDPRAAQVAGLSLWQRAHNSWQQAEVRPQDRSKISKSNIVCAEPMPGEKELLHEFTSQLKPTVLGQIVEVIFKKMQLAGEAGTLLKIEKEIEEAISEAKTIWKQQNKALNKFPDLAKIAKRRGDTDFDVSGIDDEGFWQQAEQKILDALVLFASSTSSNITEQKRLFVSGSVKGFAFINLCKKRFDVVLMNPPFGDASSNIKKYIDNTYEQTKGNLLANFIERSISIINEFGLIGAITSRACLYLSSMKGFREKVLNNGFDLDLIADLGDGVLDAMVETSAYTIAKKEHPSIFYRLLVEENKEKSLKELVELSSTKHKNIFCMETKSFKNLKDSPYSYWVNPETLSKLNRPTIGEVACDVKVGLQTGDDFRFFRNFWEVPQETVTDSWVYYSKTDSAIAWHSPIKLVVNWSNEGYEIKNFEDGKGKLRSRPQNLDVYKSPGFSYVRRSCRIVPYIVPRGCIPSAGRSQVFPFKGKEVEVLAICASNIGSAVARFRGEMFSRPTFQAGMIQQLPHVDLSEEIKTVVTSNMSNVVAKSKEYYQTDETALDFLGIYDLSIKNVPKIDFTTLLGETSEKLIASSYGLSEAEFGELQLDLQQAVSLRKKQESEPEEELMKSSAFKYLSYLVGCAFMRWTNESVSLVRDKDIYAELPPNSPVFNCDKSEEYIFSKGLADLDSNKSLIKLVEKSSKFDSVLVANAFSMLNVNNWKEFLSKPSKFFDYHYNQYSQNRRYAPIYWPLQTFSGSFTVLVYYHRINNQTLLSCTNDFIEPKLDDVTTELFTLQSESTRSAADEKLIDILSDLKVELESLRDECLRLAKFWQPNLNDGVQISAAPLWRLFQHKTWRKKLKQTWDKLEDGDYDWAHLAFSTWPDRVLKKCHVDRSLAIAHDVENDLWHEVEVIKARKKEPVWEWQPKPLSESELRTYIKEKITTDDRLKLYRSNNTNANGGA